MLVFVFSLCACGANNTDNAQNTSETTAAAQDASADKQTVSADPYSLTVEKIIPGEQDESRLSQLRMGNTGALQDGNIWVIAEMSSNDLADVDSSEVVKRFEVGINCLCDGTEYASENVAVQGIKKMSSDDNTVMPDDIYVCTEDSVVFALFQLPADADLSAVEILDVA